MTTQATLPPGVSPRLFSREEAAAYCGLSPNSFDAEVKAGTFPPPMALKRVERLLWDRKALDLALDSKIATVVDLGSDGFRVRRERWEKRREGRSQAAG
jgi:predicted DNA-binding transcriptional regulator AlpA